MAEAVAYFKPETNDAKVHAEVEGGQQEKAYTPTGYTRGLTCGGMIYTLIFCIIAYEAVMLYPTNKKHSISTYAVKTLTLDNKESLIDKETSLADHKDSFDMFFGFNSIDASKIDPVDNDYYKIEAFHWKNNKMDTTKPIALKLCKASDVPWVKISMKLYYKNALCFANKEEVKLQADWQQNEQSIPFISISHCKGKPTCKSKLEA